VDYFAPSNDTGHIVRYLEQILGNRSRRTLDALDLSLTDVHTMGSTGSGNFSDYPRGGQGGDDKCDKSFSVKLEDIEHCDYFKNHGTVPAVGTVLVVAHTKRIVAQTDTGEIVGNLPTSFNHLAGCLHQGFKYTGQVRDSKSGSVAIVTADFAAEAP